MHETRAIITGSREAKRGRIADVRHKRIVVVAYICGLRVGETGTRVPPCPLSVVCVATVS